MFNFDQYPSGYYVSNNIKFVNKYEALLYGKANKSLINYIYFDSVWEKFNRQDLGKFQLNQLYKIRAQQLRDKYDYLILYFSGGADSYNVLRSFIDNGIKLDEVCTKWCVDSLTSNTKIYNPNLQDQTAFNYLSEWDFAIKPVLDELKISHPNIKIEIVDWFKNRDEKTIDSAFRIVNHWHDSEVNSLAVWSSSERKLIEKGKRVGSIYGIDKPIVYFEGDNAYMTFADSSITMGTPNPINPFGTEYFYYSPEFPLLTFEMAKVAAEFMNTKRMRKWKLTKELRNSPAYKEADQIYQKKVRHILYTTWTDRFQAFKPMTSDRSDKHWWIFEHLELKNYVSTYKDYFNQYIQQLGTDWYITKNYFYNAIPSKKHFVCKVIEN